MRNGGNTIDITDMDIPPGVRVGTGTQFSSTPIITPGASGVEFGNYCAIGPGLKVQNTNHNYNYPSIQYKIYKELFNTHHPGLKSKIVNKGPVIVGHDVWIGANVSILSGVEIGNGCVIGLGSIVTKNIPPYSICAGVPCTVKRARFAPDVIEFLQYIKWWDWDLDKMRRNRNFFITNLYNLNAPQLANIIVP